MLSSKKSKWSLLSLPGLNLPLTYMPKDNQYFPYVDFKQNTSSLDFDFVELRYEHPLLTLRELCMLRAMSDVTDKTNWEKKIFDSTISSKWKEELMSMETPLDVGFSKAMADWCIAELRDAAKSYKKTGLAPVFNGLVQKSDSAVSPSLNKRLRAAVSPLENVSPRLQDWHPRSDGKVLNLVHPSLYPLVYGVTRVLDRSEVTLENCIDKSGEGIVLHKPEQPLFGAADGFSRDYQWLPCNIEFTKKDKVRITSYINNLHPKKNAELYSVIADVVACCIPLWNETLTAAVNPKRVRVVFDGYPQLLKEQTLEELKAAGPRHLNDPEPEPPEEEELMDSVPFQEYLERLDAWRRRAFPSTQPDPLGTFHPNWRKTPNERIGPHWFGNASWVRQLVPDIDKKSKYTSAPPVDLRRQFAKEGIQVIVKLANIQLTPEKPEYTGGTWHIEGQSNEHICASAIYYYDSENITESSLAFRYQCAWDVKFYYPQWVHHWFYDIYGLKNDDSINQMFGSVDTKEGRLITFPNTLQHRVQSFKLADPTKPGHRKILALFLVDPHIRIISTANVPCQQRDWWAEAFMSEPPPRATSALAAASPSSRGLNRLPVELQDAILEWIDTPISRAEAEGYRLDLMNERTFVNTNSEKGGCDPFENHAFSLCEH